MYVRGAGEFGATPIDQAIAAAHEGLKRVNKTGGKIAAVVSPFLTVEEAFLLASFIKKLDPNNVLALGPIPIVGEDQTFTPDLHEGRGGDVSFINPKPFTIHAEKCPNKRGVELILKHFQGEVVPFNALEKRVESGEFQGLFVSADSNTPAFDEATSAGLRRGVQTLVVLNVWPTPLAEASDVVLSGATFAEKAGCFVNFDARLQYSAAALPPRRLVARS